MKHWVMGAAALGAFVPAWLFVISPFMLAVAENAVPGIAELRLPPGTTIVSTEKGCGSGGCWVDVELRPADGMSEGALLDALGLPDDREVCELGGPPMFWTVCHWRSDAAAHLDKIVVSLAYRRTQ